jgi:ADP-ribose pyrophosphatase
MGIGETVLKPLKTEVPFSTPWFDLVAKTMNPGEEPYYSLRLPDYAVAVALTKDERVLAVRQYRPAVEQYMIEFPSGLVDAGETPAGAARRELLEETGYEADRIEILGPMTTDNGRLSNRIWGCLATGARPVQGRTPENGIELLSYSIPELATAIAEGSFDHALHIAVLMAAVLRGKLRLT